MPSLLSLPPWMLVAFAAILGAILGSFVNAAIHRLPRNISLLSRSRSFCPACQAQIAWHDNIPIASYLVLGGRCRSCRKPIPARYLVVELLCAGLFALSAYQAFVLNAPTAADRPPAMPLALTVVQMFLVANLVCAAFTDIETWYIPVPLTWPWMAVGLALAPLFPEVHLSRTPWLPEPGAADAALGTAGAIGAEMRINALIDSFQGLVLGAGIPWLLGFACEVVVGKQGMGAGDAHLLGMVGAMLGWQPAVAAFFVGIFIGSVVGVTGLLWDHRQQRRLGSAWKPRRPTFELTEEEAAGPPPAWPSLVYGGVVLAFEAPLFWLYARRPEDLASSAQPLSAVLGGLIGVCLLLAYLVEVRRQRSGQWLHGEIRERADGKKEEVLQGNYVPFGPSLALAGVIVAFYDPWLRAVVEWWFWRPDQFPRLPFQVPFLG